jgi:hypothetical protein
MGRGDRCFSVVLKYKDPSLKKFFKGPSENIFFLTRPSRSQHGLDTRFVWRLGSA